MNNEIWKDVFGFEGCYQISNFGRLKSLTRFSKKGVLIKEKILSPASDNNGYKIACLRDKNGVKSNKKVHRIVSIAFIENVYNKPHINHIDNIRSNNHFSNLEWVTQQENVKHTVKQNRQAIGIRNWMFNKKGDKYPFERKTGEKHWLFRKPKEMHPNFGKKINYGSLNWRSKIVLNLENGVFHETVREASDTYGIKYSTLVYYLNGSLKKGFKKLIYV